MVGMSDPKQNHGAMFWMAMLAAALAAVFILYPLSMGPQYWLSDKLGHPNWMVTTATYVYSPLPAIRPYWPEWYTNIFVSNNEWWSGIARPE